MRPLRHSRFIAFFAVAALLVATSAYLAHGYGDGARSHETTQCDLCLQFSGTAGASAIGGLIAKPPLAARAPLGLTSFVLPARRKVGSQLPRAPPAHS